MSGRQSVTDVPVVILGAGPGTCLERVWRCQHFSSWMTSMLHRFDDDPFRRQLQCPNSSS